MQEKLDDTCVAVARLEGWHVALARAGYQARTLPDRQHHGSADWVDAYAARFRAVLADVERLTGEWLAKAPRRALRLTP
jgi:outer membrane PBP1 activator LpoA protein